jgi:hypothetical protein
MTQPAGGTRFVYIIHKPGSDLDGEDTIIRADTSEEAGHLATVRERAWNCKLRCVGYREGNRYIFTVPKGALPPWAQEVA